MTDICKLKIIGALNYEGEITLALAHQILGIAISGSGVPNIPKGADPVIVGGNHKLRVSAKSFVASKQPVTDVEKIACLGVYLTEFGGVSRFKSTDLKKVATDAAVDISHFDRAVNNAMRQSRFLAKAGEGAKQMTSHGEAVVSAMPDRAAVSTLLKKTPTRRRKRKMKKKG